jgi:hypothetical protein
MGGNHEPESADLYQGMTSEAAEKGCFSGETPEKHASGAKARVDSIGLMPGINPRPTARLSFSAACSVVPSKPHKTTGFSPGGAERNPPFGPLKMNCIE